MTKDWERYKDDIQSLYAEHTLATVRQTMIEQYAFKASIRAYRGRLDRWGITKYKRRKGRARSHDSGGDAESIGISASPAKLDIAASLMVVRPGGRGTGDGSGAWQDLSPAQAQTQVSTQRYDDGKVAYAGGDPAMWNYGLGDERGLYYQRGALQGTTPARGLRHPAQAHLHDSDTWSHSQTFVTLDHYKAAPVARVREMNGQGDSKEFAASSAQVLFRPAAVSGSRDTGESSVYDVSGGNAGYYAGGRPHWHGHGLAVET